MFYKAIKCSFGSFFSLAYGKSETSVARYSVIEEAFPNSV